MPKQNECLKKCRHVSALREANVLRAVVVEIVQGEIALHVVVNLGLVAKENGQQEAAMAVVRNNLRVLVRDPVERVLVVMGRLDHAVMVGAVLVVNSAQEEGHLVEANHTVVSNLVVDRKSHSTTHLQL